MVARPTRKRMYKTMQGRMVDIEKLRAANESVRAVGNMNVNARGDVLGKGGAVVKPKTEVIAKYYEQPRGKVDETPARAKPTPQRRSPPAKSVQKIASVPPKKTVAPKKAVAEKKGIDAALDGIE